MDLLFKFALIISQNITVAAHKRNFQYQLLVYISLSTLYFYTQMPNVTNNMNRHSLEVASEATYIPDHIST